VAVKIFKNTKFKLSRRNLQVVLAFLWIIDGLFQLQSKMFTKSFIYQNIYPNLYGQPHIITDPIHYFSRLFLLNPVLFNLLIALTQIVIGLLILFRSSTKIGLYLSIIWGLFVWYIGEALGGLLGGHVTLLMGAPGAAILYVILAIASLPLKQSRNKSTSELSPAYWLAFVWLIIWVGLAIIQLVPNQTSLSSVIAMIASNASGAPGWLATIDVHVAHILNSVIRTNSSKQIVMNGGMQMIRNSYHVSMGYWVILSVSLIQIFIGLGVLARKNIRYAAIWIGILLSLIFWIVGQSLGQYYSGLGTDVNSAPLIILLGLSILSNEQLSQEIGKILTKIESIIT